MQRFTNDSADFGHGILLFVEAEKVRVRGL